MADLYYVGPGVIGFGDHCVRYGDKIPSWMNEKQIERFKKKKYIVDKIVPESRPGPAQAIIDKKTIEGLRDRNKKLIEEIEKINTQLDNAQKDSKNGIKAMKENVDLKKILETLKEENLKFKQELKKSAVVQTDKKKNKKGDT